MKVALYMRVSTDEQTTDNQELIINEISFSRGWEIFDTYKDIISGSKRSRPELDRLLSDARKNKFEIVLSTKVDRVGRNLTDLMEVAGTLGTSNIRLTFTDQDIDISAPEGKLMYHIRGAFAEYEREIIRERTKAGLRRARKEGKTLGRPKVNGAKVDKVLRLREYDLCKKFLF